jgi:hypothetical protein
MCLRPPVCCRKERRSHRCPHLVSLPAAVIVALVMIAAAPPRLAEAQSTQGPLEVTVIGTREGRPVLSITNTSGKPITAWVMEIALPGGPSGKSLINRSQEDAFRVAHIRPLLEPNASKEWTYSLQIDLSDFVIGETAVVFEDGTIGGSALLGEVILNRRTEWAKDMLHWLTVIKNLMVKHADNPAVRAMAASDVRDVRTDVLAGQISLSAKMKAFAELDPLVSGSNSLSARGIQQNLQLLNQIEPHQRDFSIVKWMEALEQEYANAVRHTGRGK